LGKKQKKFQNPKLYIFNFSNLSRSPSQKSFLKNAKRERLPLLPTTDDEYHHHRDDDDDDDDDAAKGTNATIFFLSSESEELIAWRFRKKIFSFVPDVRFFFFVVVCGAFFFEVFLLLFRRASVVSNAVSLRGGVRDARR